MGFFTQDLKKITTEISSFVTSLLPPKWSPSYHHKAPPTYLLRSLFHQASTDLEIIQKAIHQRRLVKAEDEDVDTLSEIGRMLTLADRLAYRGIQPAARLMKPGNKDDRQMIVTFFSETTHIRQIPYQRDLILLSIPFASVSVTASYLKTGDERLPEGVRNEPMEKLWIPIDLLAIPHELGHHIFLNNEELISLAKDENLTIPHSLAPEHDDRHADEDSLQQAKYVRWIEELFADIYGCFIAGPLSVLGLQAILADAYPGEWLHDDGRHPVPALRPFLTTEILRQLSQHDAYPAKFEHVPDLLDKNWEAILRRQGIISADQHSFEDATFTYRTDGHDYKFDARPFLFDLDQDALHHHDHHAPDRDDHETESITVKQLRAAFSEIIKFYIEALITFCDMDVFKPWSRDEISLEAYDQVLRDLVYDVRQDEYPKEEYIAFESLFADGFEHKHSDLTVNEIRSILARWDREGPEGSFVD